jgi:hypothetical protein
VDLNDGMGIISFQKLEQWQQVDCVRDDTRLVLPNHGEGYGFDRGRDYRFLREVVYFEGCV